MSPVMKGVKKASRKFQNQLLVLFNELYRSIGEMGKMTNLAVERAIAFARYRDGYSSPQIVHILYRVS